MQSLYQDLPTLAHIPPPADLVDQILTRTSARPKQPTVSLLNRLPTLSTNFTGLLRRPRFSLEASFAGTLVWLLIFGTPVHSNDLAVQNPAMFDLVRRETVQLHVKASKASTILGARVI